MYHRSQFKKYVNLYAKAFKSYAFNKYSIYDVKMKYETQIDHKKKTLLEETLPQFIKQNRVKYILVFVGESNYKAPWENELSLIHETKPDENYYGRHYKLFALRD